MHIQITSSITNTVLSPYKLQCVVKHVVKPLIAEASVVKVPLLASVYKVRPSHNRITEHMSAERSPLCKTKLSVCTNHSPTAASYP